jgi:hypothetical protein
MEIDVHGFKGADEVTYSWYLLDYFDEKTWNTSMSRCTGCTCAIFARAVAKGYVKQKGVLRPKNLPLTTIFTTMSLKSSKREDQVHRVGQESDERKIAFFFTKILFLLQGGGGAFFLLPSFQKVPRGQKHLPSLIKKYENHV